MGNEIYNMSFKLQGVQYAEIRGKWLAGRLFIFSLFNYSISVTQTIYCQMKSWQVDDEMERMWKEAVMA
jgi:hypothetical protein